jgi:hypothetical protein
MGTPATNVRDWKASLKAVAVGAVTGSAIGLVAFSFLTHRQYPGMGSVKFLFVPIAAGFSIAMIARSGEVDFYFSYISSDSSWGPCRFEAGLRLRRANWSLRI